ncbi:hypothetical protein ACETAC_01860 [Aceticella autotrophica]|uniref:Uncharacterized protein n=1 Tax=Aceticella autotrophica TaxID=2755338 RepID=A0A975AWD4_9THEO|nr:hypothetical protein [Aceticella autotrophica]QSZ27674.1 hypothetical protein ACETAC_01860 [Aceticella autotrophica]
MIVLYVIGVICFCLLFRFVLMPGYEYQEKAGYGTIKLPNKYGIFKLDPAGTYRFIASEETGGIKDSKTGEHIDGDIDAVAWNDRYVFFHISSKKVWEVNKDGISYYKPPPLKRFGILDTKTGEVNTYLTLEEAQQALVELGAGTLKLRSVEDFFPETSGETHPFEFN